MENVLVIVLSVVFIAAAFFGVMVDKGHFVSKKENKKDAQ